MLCLCRVFVSCFCVVFLYRVFVFVSCFCVVCFCIIYITFVFVMHKQWRFTTGHNKNLNEVSKIRQNQHVSTSKSTSLLLCCEVALLLNTSW